MKLKPACLTALLLTSLHAGAASQASAPLPACPSPCATSVAGAPANGPHLQRVNQLLHVSNVGQSSKHILPMTRTLVSNKVVRQALRQLDPDSRLDARQLRQLESTVQHDSAPVIQQALAHLYSVDRTRAQAAFYAQQITDSELSALLTYYRSPQGQRYLAFTQKLDDIEMKQLAHILAQPFSFNRAQQGDAQVRQQRQALLAMSSIGRRQQATQQRGNNHAANAISLISDLVAAQSGAQLDPLRQRYAGDLSGFLTFQQSAAALKEIQVQRDWEEQEGTRIASGMLQNTAQLSTLYPRWQRLAAQLAAEHNTASAAQ